MLLRRFPEIFGPPKSALNSTSNSVKTLTPSRPSTSAVVGGLDPAAQRDAAASTSARDQYAPDLDTK